MPYALGGREDEVCAVECAVDSEQGCVGECYDEQLRSHIELVGCGARDALSRGVIHERSSASACRMRVRTSRSTSFFFLRAAVRRAAVARRSVSRRELPAAS